MSEQWQYQVRVDVADERADVVRRDPYDATLAPLPMILEKHQSILKCQFDAFAEYVAEAEREGTEHFALYEWTKATIDDPAKKPKFLRNFTFYVKGDEVYPKEAADALEADLQPLVGAGLITKVAKYDTNPANNPQPPARNRT